jgi:hypothetical protein
MVDGLNYTILSEDEVEVSGFSSASTNTSMYKAESLSLPSTVSYNGTQYSVVAIGSSAFSVVKTGNVYMGAFTTISIPASIKAIGDYAFYCRNLTSVNLNEGLTYVGEFAFANTKLTEIELPQSLETIATAAFSETELTELNVNCNTIGDKAFWGTPIETLSLGENVKVIGSYAFFKCQQLTSLEIPGTVESIGDYAFNRCKNIVSLKLLEGIDPIELGDGSFQFWETVISYGTGNYAEGYEDDSALETILIARQYKALDEKQSGRFFSGASNLKTLTLAGELKDILPNSFWYLPKLSQLIIPDNIERMAYSSFLNCPNLMEWTISTDNNILSFYGDSSLNNGANWSFKNATIGRQIERETESYGSIFPLCVENILFNGEFKQLNEATTLSGHSSVESVEFQCNLECICDNGIAGTNIKHLTLPNTVVSLGAGAFKNCTSLVQFTNSDNVTEIPEQAFYNCSSLSSIHVGDFIETVSSMAFYGCFSLTEIEFTNSLQSIANLSFLNCTSLEAVRLGNNVKAINGFYNCPNLNKFYIPSIEAWLSIQEPNSFAYPYALYVDNELFENLTIPQGISTIKSYAFKGCSSLKTVDLAGITNLEAFSFDDCSNLVSFSTGNGIENLYSISGCVSLKELTLGTKVNSLYSLSDCELENVTCLSDTPPEIQNNTFSTATYEEALLTVPTGTINDYKAERGWKKFVNITEQTTPDILVQQIILTPNRLDMLPNDSQEITITTLPNNATNQSVIWTSDNEEIAKVSQNGVVLAIAPGNTIIRATSTDGSSVTSTCDVYVSESDILIEQLHLTPEQLDLKPFEYYTIIATVVPSNASNQTLKWQSSDDSVVAVSQSGYILALSVGTATITASTTDSSALIATCQINVSEDAGIESILSDSDADVKIFNLNGVLVYSGIFSHADLSPGLYLISHSNKISKLFVK